MKGHVALQDKGLAEVVALGEEDGAPAMSEAGIDRLLDRFPIQMTAIARGAKIDHVVEAGVSFAALCPCLRTGNVLRREGRRKGRWLRRASQRGGCSY